MLNPPTRRIKYGWLTTLYSNRAVIRVSRRSITHPSTPLITPAIKTLISKLLKTVRQTPD